jgi:hypothetical protein
VTDKADEAFKADEANKADEADAAKVNVADMPMMRPMRPI